MKATQTLLVFLFVLLVNCQNLQAEVENSIYSPSKNMCNPILMRRLANPTSMVQDRDAFSRVMETLRFAPDTQTVLKDLSFYSPRFVGTLMTYIQSIHILGKQVQAADPDLRNRCLSNFNVQDCRQPCDDTDVIATPNIDPYQKYTLTVEHECDSQFDNLYNLVKLSLGEQSQSGQQRFFEFSEQSDMGPVLNCYSRYSSNIIEQSECISSQDNSIDLSSIQLMSRSASTWLFQYGEYLSSIFNRGEQSDFDSQMTRVEAMKRNINLRSALNAVRNVINMKFGVGVFAEKSLRCIKAEYLLMQTL